MTELLDHITIEPDAPANAAVIWLHGLGADGHDFEPIAAELDFPDGCNVRYRFPHAPVRPVTINGGMEMRAWYDIDPSNPTRGTEDIEASRRQLEAFIMDEIGRGVPASRIVIAGFSQGGVVALHTALRFDTRLAGILALSTYLHDAEEIEEAVSFVNLDTPIFLAHGLMDPMIPIQRAAIAREKLLSMNYPLTWREYAMGHSVCPEEIMDIEAWLGGVALA